MKKSNPLEEVLTAKEAADALEVSQRHISRLCATEKLQCRNAPGGWLVLKQSVEEYNRERKREDGKGESG
ncbi:helix-turn-helix domain-containing protein [Paenibacillus tarimensis]